MSEENKPLLEESSSVEKRLWRLMFASLAIEIGLSLILADWRFTAGVVIGGSLAIINFRLLQISVRGLFRSASNSFAMMFFLRYIAIGLIISIFYINGFLKILKTLGWKITEIFIK